MSLVGLHGPLILHAVGSFPYDTKAKDTPFHRTAVHHSSDHIRGRMNQDMEFPFDQEIDLDLPPMMDTPGDVSISGPSGRGFEVADGGGMLDTGVTGDLYAVRERGYHTETWYLSQRGYSHRRIYKDKEARS